jgi:hypothetical protein
MGKHDKDKIAHQRRALEYQQREAAKLRQQQLKPEVEGESFYYKKSRETREWYINDFLKRVRLASVWPLSALAMKCFEGLRREGRIIPEYEAYLSQGGKVFEPTPIEEYGKEPEPEQTPSRDITDFDIEE